jgi:hypothetical protein
MPKQFPLLERFPASVVKKHVLQAKCASVFECETSLPDQAILSQQV